MKPVLSKIVIEFNSVDDINKCKQAQEKSGLIYRDIYMKGVEQILQENIDK